MTRRFRRGSNNSSELRNTTILGNLPVYTMATLPAPSPDNARRMFFVSDASGKGLVVSDGAAHRFFDGSVAVGGTSPQDLSSYSYLAGRAGHYVTAPLSALKAA